MENVIDAINNLIPCDDDTYIGDDGLLHCKKCGGYRQTKINVFGQEKIVRCVCPCIKDALEAENRRLEQQSIERYRNICFKSKEMQKWTFENDMSNDDNKNIKIAKNYVKHFEDMKKDNIGLLLYGNVGTGKSYTAACIANALIDKGYRVLMANLPSIANELHSKFDGKQAYIESLNHYDVVIYDDLGIERNTEYMQEQVFTIIDSRYRSGKPMIVTTNLTSDELKYCNNLNLQRVYDRVLERCTPVEFKGSSIRKHKLATNYKAVKDKLGL